jgi:diguanylate cyclase (GGDEF)-like protein
LTQVWNRKGIEKLLSKRIKTCEKLKDTFGLAIIDIDNFKQVNDVYGHCCGDLTLQTMVNEFKSKMRDSNSIGRWGGEEFLVIIEGETENAVIKALDRCRLAVAEKLIEYEDKKLRVTVSIGMTLINGNEKINALEAIKTADSALYKAKENGKNQVIYKESK